MKKKDLNSIIEEVEEYPIIETSSILSVQAEENMEKYLESQDLYDSKRKLKTFRLPL